MVLQPPSARLPTRVISTGPTTTAVVSQNFLRASTRSKHSLTLIDSLRASYPIKLLSPASANTALRPLSAVSKASDSDAAQQNLPPPPRILYMITYGGGLLADDHADLQLVVTRYAKLLVLGQGNTKIYKSPTPHHPPASQTLHSTVGPGAVFLFLGPPIVACEDSSVFLRHEILLQAQRSSRQLTLGSGNNDADKEDELPSCVVLDWITGGRGEEEHWKARRSEWRLIVRWAELDPTGSSSLSEESEPEPAHRNGTKTKIQEKEDEEEEEFVEEEDPRDVADRLAGGPVVFRDGFLIEHNPPMLRTSKTSTRSNPTTTTTAATGASEQLMQQQQSPSSTPTVAPTAVSDPILVPKMTSYAPSLYPHSTIGSLFIMGPKTERLQRSIMKRFEHMTIYPGQKPEQRADYPILWSATVVQVPRPPAPNQGSSTSMASSVPRRKWTMMNAMVVKMASQGVEQMQDFMKSLFEEQDAVLDNRKKMMDDSSDDEEGQKRTGDRDSTDQSQEQGLSVIDELFGGRVIWERAFR
ncbi:hypothetical protein BG011_000211 [Mortierella polycephala]|uniref:UreD-domain-containing protein n=1 Tax=Mortierella polycephala TaxID=41804 RepID=A0A9P6PJK1_9FUNG|nr:hypothetical protein BG011_000211 [Mortierella polycephala]